MGRFYSLQSIEHQASALLARYSRHIEAPLHPPISAEHILDTALADELGSVLWDVLPEVPGSTRLGALDENNRTIILNETRRELLLGTPGLVNTTIAHEIGHWFLHRDRVTVNQAVLPGFDSVTVSATMPESHRWDEKNAHRFMASLLMPREIFIPRASVTALSSWPSLYGLREQFDVTITALKIRLEELGFTYVDKSGVFHGSRGEAAGQQRLI